MSVLEKRITWNDLVRWGALKLYPESKVRRWFGDGEPITVDQLLDVPTASSRVFWTLFREEVVPAAPMHEMALALAEDLLERVRADAGEPDEALRTAIAAGRAWLRGGSQAEVQAARERAAQVRDQAAVDAAGRGESPGEDPATQAAAAVVHALGPDPADAFRNAFYAGLAVFPNGGYEHDVRERVRNALRAVPAAGPRDGRAPAEGGVAGGGSAGAPEPGAAPERVARPGDDALLPVGTVLAYAGVEPRELEEQGWMLCDGRELEVKPNQELYDAIGTAYGEPRPSSFNLPMLQGVFLRGVSGDSGSDPDAAARVPLQAGGRGGNQPGSLQLSGTAPPRTPFRMPLYGGESKTVDKGCGSRGAEWNREEVVVTGATGGDAESRPVNRYVYFVIKTRMTAGRRLVAPPIGAVLPFAGRTPPATLTQSWLLCNGAALENQGDYAPLWKAIRFAHGKTSDVGFLLPDYRGAFLRGVNGITGLGRDPDAASRTAPAPGGNDQNQVGSVQGCATGLPGGDRPFASAYPNLPRYESGKGQDLASTGLYHWNGDSPECDLTVPGVHGLGGDAETRPVNLSVDWYICFRNLPA